MNSIHSLFYKQQDKVIFIFKNPTRLLHPNWNQVMWSLTYSTSIFRSFSIDTSCVYILAIELIRVIETYNRLPKIDTFSVPSKIRKCVNLWEEKFLARKSLF